MGWGSICLWYLHVFSMQWYFLIFSYYLTVLNGRSLTALQSIEFMQCSGSFKWGVHLPLVSTCFLYALVFPYIFLLFDCFEWYLPLVSTCLLYSLVFPDIFILFDCFALALIDCIEKDRVHSVLWQFRMGGSISLWYLHVFSMHWYFLISFYYLPVSNGHSLVTLGSTELTQWSESFIWGKGGL